MTKHSIEIEIKSLLGSCKKAEELITKMRKMDTELKELGSHSQLNHYFEGGNLTKLYDKISPILPNEDKYKLYDLSRQVKNFSVRTRQADNSIILVVKATIDDTTSDNGTARIEFESILNNLKLESLDNLILKAGFKYQAKWSRERKEYKFKGLNVSIDKNAGYGYLAEFEMIIDDESKVNETKSFIRNIMKKLGIEELPQDRLQRMFNFYNTNWKDYYGTEKTFIIN